MKMEIVRSKSKLIFLEFLNFQQCINYTQTPPGMSNYANVIKGVSDIIHLLKEQ